MILEFKIKNYRSYKEEVVFSMEAETSKQKAINVFELELPNDETIRSLKTSVIYGANGSGKTNIIRALFELVTLLENKPRIDDPIRIYDPFKFDLDNIGKPSEFSLTFIGPQGFKYMYIIAVLEKDILVEELNYWPNGRSKNIFKRRPLDKEKKVQTGILGDGFQKKEINVFSNQLILSKFADDEPHEFISDIFLYLSSYLVINAVSSNHKKIRKENVDRMLFENKDLQRKVGILLNAVDTKIEGLFIESNKIEEQQYIDDESRNKKNKNIYNTYALHKIYKDGKSTNETIGIPMVQESIGSQMLYLLAAEIFMIIDIGGVLVVDELDTSLHPYITKLIVMLFQSEKINKNKAQLIFTTHDTTLLDRDLVRKDQVWFTEKRTDGCSDLFSLQDFDNLREDTPFEKWYFAGKFGALPNIQSLEQIYENVSAS